MDDFVSKYVSYLGDIHNCADLLRHLRQRLVDT